MHHVAPLLRCPVTGEDLRIASGGGAFVSGSGASYPFQDGVACLLPPDEGPLQLAVMEFYEREGWAEANGRFGDTQRFVDTRPAPFRFTRACIRRLGRHFRKGGACLLDAGCGPIAHEDLLDYGANFDRRVCVDLSAHALRILQSKLGERGVYLQGDLSRLPLKNETVDAALCYHVIYQLPYELQPLAFTELWRVLKPGGVAVVVYWWQYAPLAHRIEMLAKALGLRGPGEEQTAVDASAVAHNVQSRDWFESQPWPFAYSYDTYRVVTNRFMREYIPSDWRGGLFLRGVEMLQRAAPSFCGRYGVMPAILIRKD